MRGYTVIMDARCLARAVFVALALVLVAGCAGGAPSPTAAVPQPVPTGLPTWTPRMALPTWTPRAVLPTWTPTSAPAQTPSPMLTDTPAALPPTRTPTPTPAPLPPTPTPALPSRSAVSWPQVSLSPEDADGVLQLARWGEGIVSRVAYSPGGRLLVVGSSIGMHLYDAATLEMAGFLRTETGVEEVAFSPDGAYLASGGGDVVQLWRVEDGALLYTLRGHVLGNQTVGVRGLAWSPDGTLIATASHYDQVQLWRAADGALLRTLEGPDTWVEGVAFSPDGELLASAAGKQVWLWRVSDGELVRSWQGETNWIEGVAFSPSGAMLAAAAQNGLVWLWRLSDGAVLHKLDANLTSLAFSPDGSVLALGSMDGTVRLHLVSDGSLLRELRGHTMGGVSVAFSPDGSTLASTSEDGVVRLWRAEDGRLERTIEGYVPWTVRDVALSPDGKALVVATQDRDVRLWRVSDGALLRTLEGHASGVDSVAFSPDGALLASGARDNTVRLWEMVGGEPRHVLREHQGGVVDLAFSPDGTLLASGEGSEDGVVRLWWVEDGTLLATLEGQAARGLAFSPDGTTLAAGVEGGLVRLWSVTACTPTLSAEREGEDDAGGRDEDEQDLSQACGTFLLDLAMDRAGAVDIAFSPDGALLAVASGNGRVWLWQMADGTPRRILAGHGDDVTCVAFSPDGTVLASGAEDGAVRLWRVSDGTLLRLLRGHTYAVTGLAFTADGALLVSGASDGTVRFWGVSPESGAVESMPIPISTPVPALVPLSPASAFRPVTSADGLPEGEVQHIWLAPDGDLWLAADAGIFVHSGDEWVQIYAGLADRVLGADGVGCVWAVVNDGWHAAVYTGTWTLYGPGQGWDRSYGGPMATDRREWVWVATGADLRRFDPQTERWMTLSATDVGFAPLAEPLEPGHMLTDVALDGAGEVWVGNCVQEGILISGEGVRWFDGERWSGSAETAGECVYDVEVDETGRVWMGGFDALIQYDPAARAWSRFPLTPDWERPQFITSVDLDQAGNPWVTFIRFSPVGPWGPTALYHLAGDAWVADYDPGEEASIIVAFDPDGRAWMCANGVIYRMAGGQWEETGAPGLCKQIAVDGAGRVWVTGEMGRASNLWLFAPGEGE